MSSNINNNLLKFLGFVFHKKVLVPDSLGQYKIIDIYSKVEIETILNNDQAYLQDEWWNKNKKEFVYGEFNFNKNWKLLMKIFFMIGNLEEKRFLTIIDNHAIKIFDSKNRIVNSDNSIYPNWYKYHNDNDNEIQTLYSLIIDFLDYYMFFKTEKED